MPPKYKHVANLRGPRGKTGMLASVNIESVPSTQPPVGELSGPEDAKSLLLKVPQPILVGPDGTTTDTGTAALVKAPTSRTRGAMNTVFGRPDISWPAGLVAAFTFQEEAGTNAVTSDAGLRAITVPLRNGVHTKSTELGPFGPMLELDGQTLFALADDAGLLDMAQFGDEVTLIWMMKNKGVGISTVGGVHREGSHMASRQWSGYENAPHAGGEYRVAFHVGAQDGPTPGDDYNVDYCGTARMLGPLYGSADGFDVLRTRAGTYDGRQIRGYLDGMTDSNPTFTETTGNLRTLSKNPYLIDKGLNRSATPKDFSIGGATNRLADGTLLPINMTKGSLAMMVAFNRALSPEEIMNVQVQVQRRLSKVLGAAQPFTWLDFNTRDTNGTRPLSLLGLRGYEGAAAAPGHDATTGNGWRLNGTSQASGRDFLFRSAETPGIVFFPTERAFRASTLRRVRILMNSSTGTAQVRFAICIDGQWYVTHTTAAMSKAGATGTSWATTQEWKSLNLGLAAGVWRKANLSPGDATPVQMTNVMADPDANGTAFITVPGTGGAASGAHMASGGVGGGGFWRSTWSAGTTAVGGGIIVSGDNLVDVGEAYCAGIDVRSSRAQTVNLTVQYINEGGTVLGERNGPPTALAANAFGLVRTSYLATPPRGTVRIRLLVRAVAGSGVLWQANDTLDVDRPIAVKGDYLPPWFAGTQLVQIPAGLSIDTAATTEQIPNGMVDGFGLYSEAGAGTHRVAEIQLYDVA